MKLTRTSTLERRQRRIRKVISGTAERPRLSVSRSNKHIVVQAIDDTKGVTIAHATDMGLSQNKTDNAKKVGEIIAEILLKKGISSVVFDRRGRKYHGRVKAVADSVRAAGIIV